MNNPLEIPDSIRKAAIALEIFFKVNGINEWALMGVQSRRSEPNKPMSEPTPTPRTNAALLERDSSVAVDADFARTLERELAALKAELERYGATFRGTTGELQSEIDALKLKRSESMVRDMRPTWEFGSKVMNKLVLPRAHEMQPGEIAFEFLARIEKEHAALKLKLEADPGVHSCHEQCSRPMCVLRRKLEVAKSFLAELSVDGCAYGDNCPTFGSRHGKCIACKCKEALAQLNESK